MEHKEFIADFVEGLREDMLEKSASIDAKGEEYLEKVAEEFESLILLTGLDKEAGIGEFAKNVGTAFLDTSANGAGVAGHVAKGVATVGMGLATGLGALAVAKANRATQGTMSRRNYERALEQAISRSEMLADADQEKLRRFADSIFSFAPTVATDANVLTNVLTNAIHGESLDLQTIRAITELEEKLQKNNPSLLNRVLGM